MKKIPLTQGQEAIVDDHWYEYLMQWKWQARWSEFTQSYYADRRVGKDKIQMHRVVAKTPDGMECDHIHHNTLDNRESELRNVSHSQSQMNKRVGKNNKLGIKGIYEQSPGVFRAQLRFEKKKVLSQSFPSLEQAVQARKEAEIKYFGEYSTGDQHG